MRHHAFRRSVPLLSAFSFALLAGGVASAQEDDQPEGEAPAAEPSGPSESDDAAPESRRENHGDQESAEDETAGEHAHAEEPAEPIASSAQQRFARVWVGVSGSVDIAFAGAGKDVCPLGVNSSPANSLGIACTTPYGADFPAHNNPMQNAALVPGQAGALDGGAKLGDVRALLAADYAVTRAILLGVRVGYVWNTYPGSVSRPDFLEHLHLEARGTYVFGRDPLSTVGFAPLAFVGAGIAATDVHAETGIGIAGVRGKTPALAWQLGGPAFLGIGAGARYTFSPRIAFTLAWRFAVAFGSPSTLMTTAPEVALQYGF